MQWLAFHIISAALAEKLLTARKDSTCQVASWLIFTWTITWTGWCWWTTEVARCYQQIPSAKSGVIRLGATASKKGTNFSIMLEWLTITWLPHDVLRLTRVSNCTHGCVFGKWCVLRGNSESSRVEKPFGWPTNHRGAGELQASCRGKSQDCSRSVCIHLHQEYFSGVWNDLECEQCVFNHFEAKTLKKWCSRVLKFSNSVGTIWINLVLICFWSKTIW